MTKIFIAKVKISKAHPCTNFFEDTPPPVIIHRSSKISTGPPILTSSAIQKLTGPLDFLITKPKDASGIKLVRTCRLAVKSVPACTVTVL